MPTLNLWTSCIGKDSIAFACINLIIFALIKIRTRFLLLLFCGVLLGIVRPYIGFIVFFSSIISFLGRKMGIPLLYKFLIISISIFLLIFFNNINFVFLRFDALDIETLSRVFEFYQEKNIGSTSIDISSYSLPMKIFTYLFRPLFFDAKGLYMLLMSIENTILLTFILYSILILIKYRKSYNFEFLPINIFVISFFSITTFFYASTTSNLGLANRHKIQLIPPLIYLALATTNQLKRKKMKLYI